MASVSPLSPLLLRLPIYSGAPSTPSLTRRQFSRFSSSSQENGTGAVQGEEKGEETPKADDDEEDAAAARVAEELKAAMAMRKAKREEENEAGGLIGGAGEEIREIEWPAFGMVVGTTGVVVTVIAGSSVALLTVNAVLAALSDRVFTGEVLQDFFGV